MVTIIDTLSRAPIHQIDSFLPDSFTNVLEALEQESLSSKRKVEVVLSVIPPDQFLRDREYRNTLFDLLRPSEANKLAKLLDLEYADNPYPKLRRTQFTQNSSRERILFEFFEEELTGNSDKNAERKELKYIKPEYALFDYQRDAFNKIKHQLESTDNRVFLHMPTGSGKTRITMSLICDTLNNSEPGVVLWLASGQELLDQAAEEFRTAWQFRGDREVELSRFSGDDSWDDIEDGLVVAGLNKLWNKEKKSAAFLANYASKVSLVVFDEAHQSVADTYKKMLKRLTVINSDCALMGLSATPGRTYNSPVVDEELSSLYNRNKVSIDVEGFDDPFEFLTSEGYLSDPEFNELKIEHSNLTEKELDNLGEGNIYPMSVLEKLAGHELRNLRIINKVLDLISQGHHRIILFATTVEHARLIAAVLKSQDIDASAITSETPEYVREKNIKDFVQSNKNTQVLCNYNVLTTGFDAPQTDAVLIARPTKSLVLYSQMVGRAIRGPKVGGTKDAEVWTVLDTDLPGFGSLPEAFWNWEDVWQ